MKYCLCPARCGKKFISECHAVKHADLEHPGWGTPKRRGWATPHGFVDFSEPVTYEKACEVAAKLHVPMGDLARVYDNEGRN